MKYTIETIFSFGHSCIDEYETVEKAYKHAKFISSDKGVLSARVYQEGKELACFRSGELDQQP